jgi:hypothetical protein
MKNTTLLQHIKNLLKQEIKLEQMKLGDGVTVIEADKFEPENEVFVVTEDGQKIAVPVGEYELEDGRILCVEVEGIIAEIRDASTTEETAPEDEVAPEAPATPAQPEQQMNEPVSTPKKTIESVVKETFFSEIERLLKENEELKIELAKFSKVNEVVNETTELTERPKPIAFNPENEAKADITKIGSKAPRGIMDSVLNKINK